MTVIEPPLTVFVDESGSWPRESKVGDPEAHGYVTCAVAVPSIEELLLPGLLPRDASGNYMKAGDPGFNERVAIRFVEELLQLDVDVGVVTLDSGNRENIQTLDRLHAQSNAGRAREGRSRVRRGNFAYLAFVPLVIGAVLDARARRQRERITLVDVVIDSHSVADRHAEDFTRLVRRGLDRAGVRVRDIRWEREEDNTALLAPDILAAAFLRPAVHRDNLHLLHFLRQQVDQERINWIDGARFPTRSEQS